MLVGRAASNVFDRDKKVDMGGSDGPIIMRGIPGRAKVGFLTLYEYFEYMEVGQAFKSPESTVWVICSESHFTCLFSVDPDALHAAVRPNMSINTKNENSHETKGKGQFPS